MIELLVVIAIATIGVVYTSSTGEAESTAMADKSAKDALNETEGQSGIGILGIDVVARKMRQMVGLPDGAVSAESLAEYRGDEENESAEASDDPWDQAALSGDWDEETTLAVAVEEDCGEGIASGGVNDWADHALQEQVIERARLAAQMDDPDDAEAALEAVAAHADEADEAEAADVAEDVMALVSDAPEEAADPSLFDEEETQVVMAKPGPVEPGMDTQDAPMVEEFDPEQDQILIGYRPGEAGNGRIGIMEDPLRPGSAAVTLGGRCVAVVLDGFGKVRAHHIELVCEEDEGDLAA